MQFMLRALRNSGSELGLLRILGFPLVLLIGCVCRLQAAAALLRIADLETLIPLPRLTGTIHLLT
jgi:hypothetical protein